jgi:hypothetical protein
LVDATVVELMALRDILGTRQRADGRHVTVYVIIEDATDPRV